MELVPAITALSVLTALGVLCAVVFRLVPEGHHAVVTRSGVPVRSTAGGLVPLVPGLERLHVVATRPPAIDPLPTVAVTYDGVEIQIVMSVLYRVVDPVRAVASTTDVRTMTADAVERAVHHVVGQADLTDLLREREATVARIAVQSPVLLERSGVELLDIDLLDIEVRVGAQLLRLLDERT